MPAELLSFFRPAMSVSGDWSSQEIAEFYRVEAALVQAGLSVFVDRGISDEGDPWFVFCRATDGEVIVHFARINGDYLIAADSTARPIRGSNFRQALSEFVSMNPTLILIPTTSRGARLLLHPASLLAAVVATALYHMSGTEAVAGTLDPVAADGTHLPTHQTPPLEIPGITSPDRKWSDRQIAAVVGALIALTATEYSDSAKESISNLATTLLVAEGDHIVLPHSVVADASPIADLDGKVWAAGTLDAHDARFLFDSFILSGGGQAVDEQFQVSSNDGLVPKSPTVSAYQEQVGAENLWTSLFHGGDSEAPYLAWTEPSFLGEANAKGADQFATALVAPSLTVSIAGDTKPADPNHLNASVGSSSLLAGFQTFDSETAIVFVNNELNAANRTASEITLNGNLSLQDVISHAASDVFGSAPPPAAAVAQTQPTGTVAPQMVTTGLVIVSTTSFSSTQSGGPQPFTAAASEILDAFVRQNSFEVLISNHNVVLFDTNAADFSNPDFVVRTWSMSDGSTISIVGTVPHNLVTAA